MDIKKLTKEYCDLAPDHHDRNPKEKQQAMIDLIKTHVSNIDWTFEDEDEIFSLLTAVINCNDLQSFQIILDSGFDINTVNSKFETISMFLSRNAFEIDMEDSAQFLELVKNAGANFTKRSSADTDFFWNAFNDQAQMDRIQKSEDERAHILKLKENHKAGKLHDIFERRKAEGPLPAKSPDLQELERIKNMPGFMETVGEPQADGFTLYHLAVKNNAPLSIMKHILKNGHDVDAQCTRKGDHYLGEPDMLLTERAIHIACNNTNINMVNLLLEYGADVNYPRSDGKTPLQIAISAQPPRWTGSYWRNNFNERRRQLIENLLQLSNANVIKQVLKVAASSIFNLLNQSDGAINSFLESKNIDLKDIVYDDGTTILHEATRTGNFELFKYCVKSGIDLNVTNNSGDTPLHFACAEQQDKITMQLIKLGADFEKKNIKNISPLDILTTKGNAPMIEFALSRNP
ncbi:MAG: ankyrin repeat domain-containing protein [Firmicutes bacterium]|nr:ankyrin repeat domain-containing protein [Bacillota bacterium]